MKQQFFCLCKKAFVLIYSSCLSVSSGCRCSFVLLNFWATWWRPWLKEFPELKAYPLNMAKANFIFVGIVGDLKAENAKNLMISM